MDQDEVTFPEEPVNMTQIRLNALEEALFNMTPSKTAPIAKNSDNSMMKGAELPAEDLETEYYEEYEDEDEILAEAEREVAEQDEAVRRRVEQDSLEDEKMVDEELNRLGSLRQQPDEVGTKIVTLKTMKTRKILDREKKSSFMYESKKDR